MRWARLSSVLVAMLAMVVFSYALANVTMRLQRHIASANQWQHDRRALTTAYAGLSSAAAAKDDLAYRLLRRIAWEDTVSLREDSLAMRSEGNAQRMAFVASAQRCLPKTMAGFGAQTSAERTACQRVVAEAR